MNLKYFLEVSASINVCGCLCLKSAESQWRKSPAACSKRRRAPVAVWQTLHTSEGSVNIGLVPVCGCTCCDRVRLQVEETWMKAWTYEQLFSLTWTADYSSVPLALISLTSACVVQMISVACYFTGWPLGLKGHASLAVFMGNAKVKVSHA